MHQNSQKIIQDRLQKTKQHLMNKDEQFDRSLYENNKIKGSQGVKKTEFMEHLYLR